MITITKIGEHTIDYDCSCGISGECMFKAPKGNATIVINLKCPMCGSVERLKLIKYDSEKHKKRLSSEDADLFWGIIVDNKVKE